MGTPRATSPSTSRRAHASDRLFIDASPPSIESPPRRLISRRFPVIPHRSLTPSSAPGIGDNRTHFGIISYVLQYNKIGIDRSSTPPCAWEKYPNIEDHDRGPASTNTSISTHLSPAAAPLMRQSGAIISRIITDNYLIKRSRVMPIWHTLEKGKALSRTALSTHGEYRLL